MAADQETLELIDEALLVGMLSVPAWLVADGLIRAIQGTAPGVNQANLVTVFFAGVLFHVGAEVGGFNDWYVDNGLAKRKKMINVYSKYAQERPMMGYYFPTPTNSYGPAASNVYRPVY